MERRALPADERRRREGQHRRAGRELPVNRWIIGEVVETLAKLNRAFDELRFDDMADAIYHFVWGTFCDWYVELIKGAFDDETKAVAAWAFDQILVMLHPLMPFITEELWNAMGERPYELIVAKWPEPEAEVDPHAQRDDRCASSRSARRGSDMRAELNIPPGVLTLTPTFSAIQTLRAVWRRNSCDRSTALAKLMASSIQLARCGAAKLGAGGR